jgi:hypothetical protein
VVVVVVGGGGRSFGCAVEQNGEFGQRALVKALLGDAAVAAAAAASAELRWR